MKIGIDASRAFLENRTGIEDYSYELVDYLTKNFMEHEVVVYLRKGQSRNREFNKMTFNKNIEIREIKFYRFWTQIGLAMELLINPVDILFIPAHTIPWVHPRNTVVTIHGLEYEHCPESYSLYSRLMHRFFIKRSCRWAKKIIAVSKKTEQDLVEMYKTPKDKIEIVYNGYGDKVKNQKSRIKRKTQNLRFNYVLFIGRLEKRKNVEGVIEVFEMLKDKYNYSGKLILAGKPGYGHGKIRDRIQKSKYGQFIIKKGFIDDKEKWELLKSADVFLFPSVSEGFGIPILEAQNANVPVITSNYGPMDEVAGNKDILADPKNYQEMAKLANRLISNKQFRRKTIEKGRENIKRFSWQKSAAETKSVLESVFE